MAYRQQPPKPVGGFYPQTKVYSDGSHYIAIPHTERPYRPKRKHVEEVISVSLPPSILTAETVDEPPLKSSVEPPAEVKGEPISEPDALPDENAVETLLTLAERLPDEVHGQTGESPQKVKESPKNERKLTRKGLFNELYAETVGVKKAERRKKIVAAMRPYFKDEKSTVDFVNNNFERKRRNLISRRIRLSRKINLQDFNYFVTVTYFYGYYLFDSYTYISKLEVKKGFGCSKSFLSIYLPKWEQYTKSKLKIKYLIKHPADTEVNPKV